MARKPSALVTESRTLGAPFFVEIGADQKSAVEALFRDAGAQGVATIQDLSARDRVITGHKKPLGIPGGFG